MWRTIGHEWVAAQLSVGAASGVFSRANLFTGPPQIGKLHLAREYAAALNCIGDGTPPCGVCTHCTRIMATAHPDVSEFLPEDGHIKIGQIRAMQHQIALRPYEARWRVAIIGDLHTATEEAENALLKTLEEPPARSVIMLTARDAGLLQATVVSRCRVLGLQPVPSATVSKALAERGLADPDVAEEISRLSGGRVGWALQAAQDPALLQDRSDMATTLLNLLEQGHAARLSAAENISRSGDPAVMLAEWQSIWRDVMLISAGCDELVANRRLSERLHRLSDAVGLGGAQRALADLRDIAVQLDQNVNPRLALQAMLIGWCTMGFQAPERLENRG
ncbi:MAG: hypothetical protein GXX94_06535 [Chloroflexi bacterium]|nr:hypothetical protein [Chloroflexota bacterium]